VSPPYTVLRPDNRYASRLPNLRGALLYKLVTPRHAPARLGQYLVALEPGGGTSEPVAPGFEDFLYVLEGEVPVVRANGIDFGLRPGGWCYLPPDMSFELEAGGDGPAEVLWIKRRLEPWPGLGAPEARSGHRDDEPFEDTPVPGLRRRELLDPADPRHDFNMSLLAFDAGVGLAQVEIHDEEHGLYMTAGGGRYHLDGADHDVSEGDFIYMAPYCPQSFTAAEDTPAEYLLYKDVYRDGF
jgi:(S)-ureidoglycine aminohydrolase